MLLALSLFWFIRSIRIVLFWIYLWQLKEYHIGRFLDHFRTHNGKRLIFQPIQLLKIVLAAIFIFLTKWLFPNVLFILFLFLSALLIIYFAEVLLFLKTLFAKKIKKPVFTKKAIALIFVNFLILFLVLLFVSSFIKDIFFFVLTLLFFDIFAPLIVSVVVLLFQPFVVLLRSRIIKQAAKKRESFSAQGGSASGGKNLIVIGITGSYGKTSTKEFLATILSQNYKVLKTKEHQNSEMGIAQCILQDLKPEHEVFVAEMASYAKGGISLLCDIIKPKIGVITGVNEQHLALYGSMASLLSAEGGKELIESLPQDGLIILNGDNEIIKNYPTPEQVRYGAGKPKLKKVMYYSVKERADMWAEDIVVEREFLQFKVKTSDNKTADFKVNVLGAQNIQNILAAALVARELGMNLRDIAKACEKINPNQGGMVLKKGKNGINIIDSSYSSNPDGVIADLDYLKTFPKKKVIVMPCLIELGKASKKIHIKIGKKIGQICDLAIITTKDRFKEIKEGALSAKMKEKDICFLECSTEIFSKIHNFCTEEDVVLLEGRVPLELIQKLLYAV